MLSKITRSVFLAVGELPPVRFSVASFQIWSPRRLIMRSIFVCDGGKNHQSARRQSGTGPMIYRFQITWLSGS